LPDCCVASIQAFLAFSTSSNACSGVSPKAEQESRSGYKKCCSRRLLQLRVVDGLTGRTEKKERDDERRRRKCRAKLTTQTTCRASGSNKSLEQKSA
jgi:hypothetical protein